MIKVMGGKGGTLPLQLAGLSAGGSGTNVKTTFVKTSGEQVILFLNSCFYLSILFSIYFFFFFTDA